MAYQITETKRKIYEAVQREYRREDLLEAYSEDFPFLAGLSEKEQNKILDKIDDALWHCSLYYEAYWSCFESVLEQEKKERKSNGKHHS